MDPDFRLAHVTIAGVAPAKKGGQRATAHELEALRAEWITPRDPDAGFPPPVERLTPKTPTVVEAPASVEVVETPSPVAEQVVVEAPHSVDMVESPTSTPAPAVVGNTLNTTSEATSAPNPETDVAVASSAGTPAAQLSRHVWDKLAAKVHAHT